MLWELRTRDIIKTGLQTKTFINYMGWITMLSKSLPRLNHHLPLCPTHGPSLNQNKSLVCELFLSPSLTSLTTTTTTTRSLSLFKQRNLLRTQYPVLLLFLTNPQLFSQKLALLLPLTTYPTLHPENQNLRLHALLHFSCLVTKRTSHLRHHL